MYLRNYLKKIFSVKLYIIIAIFSFMVISNTYAAEEFSDSDEDDYNYSYGAINNRCKIYDPYEGFNRKIFIFNGILDTFITRPIAKAYGHLTNDYVKGRVDSFIVNIDTPRYLVNYTFQGNSEGMFKSFWRFIINSTVGIGGLFDVASKMGLTVETQTFGNTLAHYGVAPGPYIIIPLLGGTFARDMTDPVFTNSSFNPVLFYTNSNFDLGLTASKTIHNRDKIMPFTDYVTKHSIDPYITIRDAIYNNRESKIIYPKGFVCPKVN